MRLGNRKVIGNIFKSIVATGIAVGLGWVAYSRQIEPKADTNRVRVVLTDTEAFLVDSPELIAGSSVKSISPAPDGKYVLVSRVRYDKSVAVAAPGEKLTGEASLILWNSRTRKAATVWRHPINATEDASANVFWLQGSPNAILQITTSETTNTGGTSETQLAILHIGSGSLDYVPDQRSAIREFIQVLPSPTQPFAVLQKPELNGKGLTLTVLQANGSTDAPIALPTGTYVVGWTSKTEELCIATSVTTTLDGKRKTTRGFALVNPKTGQIIPTDKKPADLDLSSLEPNTRLIEALPKLPIRLIMTNPQIPVTSEPQVAPSADKPKSEKTEPQKSASGITVPLVWLESNAPGTTSRTLIAADAEAVTLLPDASAALYLSRGSLFAAPLVRLDKKAYLNERRKAQQIAAISNAKQVGLGILMYTQDYDEIYPLKEDTKKIILPYIKNEDVFTNPATGENGFVYLIGGVALSTIDKPAETPIGYVAGPGGRAIIYADGHVKWQSDDPQNP